MYKIKDFWAGMHFIGQSIKWSLFILAISFVGLLIAPLIYEPLRDPDAIQALHAITVLSAVGIASLIILLIPVIYYVNSQPLTVKDDQIIIPASDIENGFWDLITLKRVRGLYYRVSKPIESLVDAKYDFGRDINLQPYHGNSRNKQWKINITFNDSSNYQVYFSNKQKRDAAIAILKNIRNYKGNQGKAHFGPDITF